MFFQDTSHRISTLIRCIADTLPDDLLEGNLSII
jgi:hypothetical protein